MSAAVALTSLFLTDLRNYPSLSLRLGSWMVVLTGPNGAGKTNLLEAVSLLTPGRGLRRAGFEEIARVGGGGGWAVAATVEREGVETRLGTGTIGPDDAPESGRRIRINGAPAPSAEALLDYLRILWLTPAMDGLFTGPAGDRRRFLDRLVLTIDPAHGRRVRDFERLLTSRNRLLEEGARSDWIGAVEAQLAGTAVAVALARSETLALLSARTEASAAAAAGFPAGRLALTGDFDAGIAGRTASEAELWFAERLRDARPRDRAARRTLEGPHRSDLDVVFAEKGMPAALSSTGEQKALLIGLILAHAELVAAVSGMTPVLLLDEVAAHLDKGRRAALFTRLDRLGGQCFMTGTDPGLFEAVGAGATRLDMAAGEVSVVS